MTKFDEAYIKLAERNGKADSERLHRILEKAMTPEEARFLLELPASPADLAAKFNMDEKAIESKIKDLSQRGLLVASRRGYRYPGSLGTLHDNILASAPQYIPPGMDKLWMDFYEGDWWREVADQLIAMGNPTLRAILAPESIPPGVELLQNESIEALLNANKELISVRNCCCRVMAKSCDRPIFTCTQFGRRAEYDLFRGSGKKVSADEALDVSLKATKAGLVPTVTNIRAMEALEFICYCCSCCCVVLEPASRIGKMNEVLASSRFVGRVDNETCNGCEECVSRCFFSAIELKKVPGLGTPKAVIDTEKCRGCGLCVLECGPEAITMELTRPPEFIPETIAGPSSIVH